MTRNATDSDWRYRIRKTHGKNDNSQAIHYLTCHPRAPTCTVVWSTRLLWPGHFLVAVQGGWCDSQQGSRSLSPAAPARTPERGNAFIVALRGVGLLLLCLATLGEPMLKEVNKQLQLLPRN